MKIKALSFVLTAALLLCGCGQKSGAAAAAPAQAVSASAVRSSTARPVSTGVENNKVDVRRFSTLG